MVLNIFMGSVLVNTSCYHTCQLFNDEVGFTRDSILNYHDSHVSMDENPHTTIDITDINCPSLSGCAA